MLSVFNYQEKKRKRFLYARKNVRRQIKTYTVYTLNNKFSVYFLPVSFIAFNIIRFKVVLQKQMYH